jgi:hypothetical protein
MLNEKENGQCIGMNAQTFSPIRDTEKYINIEYFGVSIKEILTLSETKYKIGGTNRLQCDNSALD